MRFRMAYDTLALKGHGSILKSLIGDIRKWSVSYNSSARYANRSDSAIPILADGNVVNIPTFQHPISIPADEIENNYIEKELSYVTFFDARELATYETVKNKMEYNFQFLRASIQNYGMAAGSRALRDISSLPLSIFSSWITENISRKFSLQPSEQYLLSIYSAIYYISLFGVNDVFTEEEIPRYSSIISQAINVKVTDVLSMFDDIEEKQIVLTNINDFCTSVGQMTNSIRLSDLRPAVLYTVLQGTWYGYNSRELVPVALEHIPTWMSIVAAASSERGYSKSGIAAIIERRTYNEKRESYVKSLFNLISFEKK